MKKIALFVALAVSIIATDVYASFPVNGSENKKEVVSNNENNQILVTENENASIAEEAVAEASSNYEKSNDGNLDDKLTLLLLWFFLGGFAAHRWYAKKPVGANILFIITAGGCGVWAIIDLIKILQDRFM